MSHANPIAVVQELFSRDPENPGICVVDGYGAEVTTRSGRLVVRDGIGSQRRQRVYARANHGLSRLVVLAGTGYVTFEATRWLREAGVGLVQVDVRSGEIVVTSSAVANDDARLRRAQALAPATVAGLEVCEYLISLKLSGEDAIAERLGAHGTSQTIENLRLRIGEVASLEEIRQLEAAAANLYWAAWSGVEPTFVNKDTERVPENWLRFEGRRSAVNPGSPRNASDPIGAMLNYSYKLLEAEAQLALIAVGLDPGMGILHADMRGRSSLVLDIIEASRPLAELHLLKLLEFQPLCWRDFAEDGRGVVRVLAPLSHRLAEAMPGFASSLAPVVERVAQMIASASPYDVAIPSVLKKEKHRAAARRQIGESALTPGSAMGPGMVGLSPRKKRRRMPPASLEPALPLPICKGCGAVLMREPDRLRRRGAYCQECLAARRIELGRDLPTASRLQAGEFTERAGRSPTHNPNARERRRHGNANQRSDQAQWESQNLDAVPDQEWFRSQVLPVLKSVTLTEIAKATGMSTSAASKVRAGRRVPHARHWEALAGLADR